MATQAKRKLKAPAAPKQTHQHKQAPSATPHAPIEHLNDQAPLPPHYEKHRNTSEPTSKTSAPLFGALDDQCDQPLADEEDDEADPDGPSKSQSQTKLKPEYRDGVPRAHHHKRAHLRKHHSSSPFPAHRSPVLRGDDSDEDDVFTKRSRHASLTAHSSPLREPRRSKTVDSDSGFDVDMSEAIWGHHADQSGVMITWAGDSDHEGSDHTSDGLEIQIKEQDLEELLAWGNGEVSLPGMPEVLHSDFWPQHGPFFELDSSSSNEEGQSDDSDDSFDSVEEEEQMLALRGLCGFGTDSDGDTTDSIDDTDHDNLVRFGIEQTEEQSQTRKSGKRRKAQRRSSTEAAASTGPVLGHFKPQTPSGSAVIETAEAYTEPIMSPFSVKKYRVLRTKAASDSLSGRRRTGSIASSSQQSTMSAPGVIEQDGRSSPSPITDIPEEEEEVYMDLDLDDILDLDSALHAEFEVQLGDWEEPDTDHDTVTMADLSRWDRIPIGAYRKSRSPPKALLQAMQGQDNALPGNGQLYLPMASLFSKRESVTFRVPSQFGRKRKITRQEAIGLSPIMCPIKPVPSSMKSRRAKRAERKAIKKSHAVAGSVSDAGPSPEKNGMHIPDNEVPVLDLPGSSAPLLSASAPPAAEEHLAAPTLPSAECMPLASPLFAAVRTQPSPGLLPQI